ncbi:hypothetical protein HHL22_17440 [Hymenobacter sp. RP-2-7]|uniref:DUF4197 domain-containing protein n=1 Tax=Hymenobacter polaris TaxID=2682546 RepID=A0A7Y0AGL8_9BACT|nr:hypothetical protein [Hymenobacter polaris]NML66993.1 hypothetical protein [Hymenobacter polaris]
MKHFLLSIIVVASLLLASLVAQAAPTLAPADTVAGQARFAKIMSAGMCAKLEQESQKTDLTKLPPAESEALFKKLMLTTMGDNFVEFSALLEKKGKGEAEALGRAIGEQAVFDLMQTCPKAAPLLAKLGSRHVPGGAEITPAEREILLPMTQDACQRLSAENAKQPLDQRTPAQRAAAVEQALQGVFMSHSDALTLQYGDEVLQDEAQAVEIGKKLGLLMLEVCPAYIALVGRDHLDRQRAEASLPAAKPKVPAPTKPQPTKKKAPAVPAK